VGDTIRDIFALRAQISWFGAVQDGDLVSFTATSIRLANGDGTFTDIAGTNFNEFALTGDVTSISQIDTDGTTVLHQVSVTATLETTASALFNDNADDQVLRVLNTGDNTITVNAGPVTVGDVNYTPHIDGGPGNDTYVGANGFQFVDFDRFGTSGVTVNLST